MSEFKPVSSVAEFQSLDEAEVLLGYLEGFDGRTCPHSGCSRSFFHGWRNGMVDGGHAEPDSAQLALAHEFETGGHVVYH